MCVIVLYTTNLKIWNKNLKFCYEKLDFCKNKEKIITKTSQNICCLSCSYVFFYFSGLENVSRIYKTSDRIIICFNIRSILILKKRIISQHLIKLIKYSFYFNDRTKIPTCIIFWWITTRAKFWIRMGNWKWSTFP